MEHKNKRDVKLLIVINTKTLNTDKLLAQLTLKLQNLLPIQYIQLKTSEVMANGKKKTQPEEQSKYNSESQTQIWNRCWNYHIGNLK